MLIAKLL